MQGKDVSEGNMEERLEMYSKGEMESTQPPLFTLTAFN